MAPRGAYTRGMNHVVYIEIQATNPEKTAEFYQAVFGWKFTKVPDMPVDYWQIEGTGLIAALLRRPAAAPAPEQGINGYVCSVQVDDFDTMAEKITANGGTVALPKFAVPGKCYQGYFIDTDGNTFGLFQVDEHAA
jgi:uncharacterized protein